MPDTNSTTTEQGTSFDNDLADLKQKKFAERLTFLRQQSPRISPEEIYLLLDPTEVEDAAEEHFARLAYTLESWRSSLVLLPVLITWLSLGLAALAYTQSYPIHPDQPFLKLWTDGFPGITWPVPSFPQVAALDVLLLLTMVALTVLVQYIEKRAREKATSLRLWLDNELYTLARASEVRSLGAGQDNKKPAWAVDVHAAISHLDGALTGVATLVNASQDAVKLLVASSQTNLENMVQASQEKLEGSIRQFSDALGSQREAVDQFMSGTMEVRRAVDKLERIYVEGEQIYQELNQTLPKIEGAFSTMATHQNSAATQLESISSNSTLATKAVGDIAQRFTQVGLVESTAQAAFQMQQTAEIMRKVALQMGDTVHQQMQLQNQQRQWISRIPAQPVPSRKRRWLEAIRQRFPRKPTMFYHVSIHSVAAIWSVASSCSCRVEVRSWNA